MSAVMSTLSMISGGRRAHRKLTSRKSGQFSDAGEERTRTHHDLKQQRSASLQTLEASGGGGVVNLENLEAKMASIEVSLAGRRRSAAARDVARELDALRTALTDKDSLIQSLKKQLSASLSAARLAAQAAAPSAGAEEGCGAREECAALSPEERRALQDRAATLDAELDARNNNIQELRKRLERTHVTDNIDTRIQQAELQYQLGREELELLTLGEQARALAQLIEHAAAAAHHHTLYSMVRECGGQGNLMAVEVREGSWAAAPRGGGMLVDWAAENSPLRTGDRLVEMNGVLVVWCRSAEELARAAAGGGGGGGGGGARLVLLRPRHPDTQRTFTQNEAASLRAELGALKSSADDAEKAKEGLRADNTRLTHRISYLEEQVADLLVTHHQLQSVSSSDSCITVNKTKKNVTNINIGAEPPPPPAPAPVRRPSPRSEVQVFQKGPDITALVAKLPGLDHCDSNLPLLRPRSNASGASSRAPGSPRASPPPTHRSQSSHSLEHRAGRMRPSLSHHTIRADYAAETDAAIRMIERNQRHMEKQRSKGTRSRDECLRSDSELDRQEARDPRHRDINHAATRIEETIKKTNWAERKTLSIIEQLKRSQRLRKTKKNESAEDVRLETEKHHSMYHRIDGKVLENAHKSSRRTSKLHSRSARSSELDSEWSDYPHGEYGECGSEACSTRLAHYRKHEERREGEGKARPTPPRKPLRLSLHKARSAHSLLDGGEAEAEGEAVDAGGKRPVKRTHAAGAYVRECARATPRPHRKLNGLTAPQPDALYPEGAPPAPPAHRHLAHDHHQRKWC